MNSAFEQAYGFPRSAVTLATWRTAPYSRWSFQNVREAVPDMQISCARERAESAAVENAGFLNQRIDIEGRRETVGAFLARSHTDLFVAVTNGKFVAEYTAPTAVREQPHILFSISKSFTGLAAGILEAQGIIDSKALVTRYVPEAKASAYGNATLRHLLDMRVSLAFDESYLNTDGDYARYRRATLWNPAIPGERQESLAEFLVSLKQAPGDHGGAFRYASPNSDLLGLVIERAAGRRFADLISALIWVPLDAHHHGAVTLDRAGTARAAGGMSITARDLARLGDMLRCGGAIEGRQIVPERWVNDMRNAGDPEAWRAGDLNGLIPGGRYRSKWYQTADGAFCAIGIHGQWLYVDPSRKTVLVKMSSQPLPQDDALDRATLAFLKGATALFRQAWEHYELARHYGTATREQPDAEP